ncbi:MAG: c-type cytochrome [Pseudomonadales bacterium]
MNNQYRVERTLCGPADDVYQKALMVMFLVVFLSAVAGCSTGPDSPRGFSLPKGDAERGQQVFVRMECTACHTVAGMDLPDPEEMLDVSLMLGGDVHQVKTYADLVTSIINPSHKIVTRYPRELATKDGVSKMPIYNDLITVTDLIDLVTFLESKYVLKPYTRTNYGPF